MKMIKKIFTVFDAKAEIYLPPFYMHSKGEAIRAFQTSANDQNLQIGKYPEDFTLYEIGEYDDSTAEIKTIKHLPLGKAIEFVKEN
jgi:hypothetical protein